MRTRIDYTSKKIGKLTGVKVLGKTNCENKLLIWKMICDCGQEVIRTTAQIRSGCLQMCIDCKTETLKYPRHSKFFKGTKRAYNKKEV